MGSLPVGAILSSALGFFARTLSAILGISCILISILYAPEYPILKNYFRKTWRSTRDFIRGGEQSAGRFLHAVFFSVERTLSWFYGEDLVSPQTAAVFFCTAIASFGLGIALAKTGITSGWTFYHRVKYQGEYLPNNGGFEVPWIQFLATIGVAPETVPFFYSVCAFFLLLSLVPAVIRTIQGENVHRTDRYVLDGVCSALIAAAFLFFEHIAHAFKPWPQLERRLETAAFALLGFGFAFAGLILFRWVTRKLLNLAQSSDTWLRLFAGLLYMPIGLLLLLPS